MFTIFSIPKPFIGHIGVIQRNAIQSWKRLGPEVEIVLFGDEVGTAEIAKDLNLNHLPEIKKNEFGTPILNSAFNIARQVSTKNLLCYVNSDILLLSSLINSINKVNFSRFLMVGQRWNLDLSDPIDFSDAHWEDSVIKQVKERGKLQPPFGSDYFIYPKTIDWKMPDFVVGRPGWDNWLIYQARSYQLPVIDATGAAMVVHQNHNYAHIPEGQDSTSFEGPEALANRSMMNGNDHSFGIGDSTHFVSEGGVKRASEYEYLRHRIPHQKALDFPAGNFRKFSLRIMQSIIYRKQLFPNSFLENILYSLSK